jgi:single-stranded-DNA-specific exonuclease
LAIDGDVRRVGLFGRFGLPTRWKPRDIIRAAARARGGRGVLRRLRRQFRVRINEYAEKSLGGRLPEPTLEVDDEVRLEDVTPALARELARLEPHGEGNRAPRLVASHVSTAGRPRLMGKQQNHLSFHVAGTDGPGLRAVAFGRADWFDSIAAARTVSLAFRPVINEWMGRASVELHVDDVKFA